MSQITQLITGLEPIQVTNTFVLLILVVFAIALLLRIFNLKIEFVNTIPSVMPSIGILGTFLGIAIGLASFDYASQESIDKSIPRLLSGMNTAFITSIAGIFFGLLFKIMDSWLPRPKNVSADQIGAADIYQAIRDQSRTFDSLRLAIVGDEESTIVTQLQKLRTDIRDDLKTQTSAINKFNSDLRNDFEGFADRISELGSKQLIEALGEVIRDFNSNLTEQFGDNFKRLDDFIKTWRSRAAIPVASRLWAHEACSTFGENLAVPFPPSSVTVARALR